MFTRLLPIVFLVGLARSASAQTPTTHPITIGETHKWRSVELNEDRVIHVYLPLQYKATDTTRYDVVYVLDGSLDEDFLHLAGLVQFFSFPWINGLRPSLVVGIANVDRKRDFSFPTTVESDHRRMPKSGGSARFMDYLAKEVQPFLARQYRLSGRRILIGQSLGGLLATEILLKRPALFDTYIIISPSLWWDGGSLLQHPTPSFEQPTRVYIGVGKEGLTGSEPPRVMEVDANVLADRLRTPPQPPLKVYFDYLPEHNHATVGHQAVYNAFRWLSGH